LALPAHPDEVLVTDIDEEIAKLLRVSGLTLSVAESCSGGLIAKRITDVPGSSAYFLLGAVTYSNSSKERVLGVPAELIQKHGAVSGEVAMAMAEGVRRVSGSDIAIATTGIAGPDGGTFEKPVGTVYIAIDSSDGSKAYLSHFEGDRTTVREATAEAALRLLLNRFSSPHPS
jgi:nicotinamide-nucleotide amidase